MLKCIQQCLLHQQNNASLCSLHTNNGSATSYCYQMKYVRCCLSLIINTQMWIQETNGIFWNMLNTLCSLCFVFISSSLQFNIQRFTFSIVQNMSKNIIKLLNAHWDNWKISSTMKCFIFNNKSSRNWNVFFFCFVQTSLHIERIRISIEFSDWFLSKSFHF